MTPVVDPCIYDPGNNFWILKADGYGSKTVNTELDLNNMYHQRHKS